MTTRGDCPHGWQPELCWRCEEGGTTVIEIGTRVPELTQEHADGTVWVDIEGDLWEAVAVFTMAGPVVAWRVTRRRPFCISSELGSVPGVEFGPYVAVLGPPPQPQATEEDGQP
ncbi:hypothetical protein I5G58_gp077 [Mycobacterium phage BirdsNest]|uniref:Uncharacterized protein n=1 Tax=Mycobacterium phage BirdsNest TaxID=2686231 RepID=A0A6B9LJ85_9CAUD|nr:hypothetical protein I5G58_gp077 [Mycobacterium phage BirdsNest]QHB37379.1 hypothetical protein PBI_BIRDSNEST_77 [Mycobacterium phage BirdsNest]